MRKSLLSLAGLAVLAARAFAVQPLSERLVKVAKIWDRPSVNAGSVDLRLERYQDFQAMVTPGRLYLYGIEPKTAQFPGSYYVVSIEESVLKSAGIALRQGDRIGEGQIVDVETTHVLTAQEFALALRQATRAIDVQDGLTRNRVR